MRKKSIRKNKTNRKKTYRKKTNRKEKYHKKTNRRKSNLKKTKHKKTYLKKRNIQRGGEIMNDGEFEEFYKEFIEKVLNYINESIGDPNLNVESLASQLNLSRSQFYRKIKALTNQTANEFIRNIRLLRAKQIIETGSTNISEVCYKVGFSSPSYFTKCFKSYFGVLPKEIENLKP